MSIAAALVIVIILGIAAQWAAWQVRMPSILVLLIAGFAIGPAGLDLIEPDKLLGDLLFPVVSLSVAIILFEGSLSLRLEELRRIGSVVRNLLSIGLLATWGLSAWFAYHLLELGFALSLLVGALLTVTGPTVIVPLLRHLRLTGQTGSILKWEGIVIDPIGAVLSILVFEAIISAGAAQETTWHVIFSVFKTIVIGGGLGAVAAGLLVILFRRELAPEFLHNPLSLVVMLGAFVAANQIQHESGLLTVTVMGFMLANQKTVPVKHIIEFNTVLGTLLISTLFVLLAARIDIELLAQVNLGMLWFVLALLFLVRPASVLLASLGQKLRWQEIVFLSFMAPRGIVAAAVSSILALDLMRNGYENGELLGTVVLVVIAGTVAFYGLCSRPLAKMLKLSGEDPQGVIILGAHTWARDVARALSQRDVPVLILDTNPNNIRAARLQGLNAINGNILDNSVLDRLELHGIGRLLALTSNDEVNALAALHMHEVFGRMGVYQISPFHQRSENQGRDTVPRDLRGRRLFGREYTFSVLNDLYLQGWRTRSTKLTKEFPFEKMKQRYDGQVVTLFAVTEEGKLSIDTAERPLDPRPGQYLISFVKED